MLYNYWFDAAAAVLTLFLLLLHYLRRTWVKTEVRVYRLLLWLNLIAALADLVSAWTISFPERFPLWLNYGINILYLSSYNLSATTFLLFMLTSLRGKLPGRRRLIAVGILVLAVVLPIATTPLTGLVFFFDEDLSYVHGPLFLYLYVLGIGSVLWAGLLFVRSRRKLPVFRFASNLVYLILVPANAAFSAFFPEVLLCPFVSALALLVIHESLDPPLLFLNSSIGCYNQTAFDTAVSERLREERPFVVLAATVENAAFYRRLREAEGVDSLETVLLGAMKGISEKVFLLNNGAAAVFLDGVNVPAAVTMADKAFRASASSKDNAGRLQPYYCVVRYPGYVRTTEEVNESLLRMLGSEHGRTGQKVTEDTVEAFEQRERRTMILGLLREALRHDGFEVWFQPILDTRSGRFLSAEALIRLKARDKQGKSIGPDEFIPLAEQNGLILEIGELVFDRVCRFLGETDACALGLRYVELNLSMLQLLQRDLPERFSGILRRWGVSVSRLNLEITETASSDDRVTIRNTIDRLREVGFRFSLDDYGSGYASAAYLTEMPFDIVKVDRDILWRAMEDPDARAVLRHTMALIRSLKKESVCEGVETEEMAEMLRSFGCDFFQGYLYARPMPEADFLELLRRSEGA